MNKEASSMLERLGGTLHEKGTAQLLSSFPIRTDWLRKHKKHAERNSRFNDDIKVYSQNSE